MWIELTLVPPRGRGDRAKARINFDQVPMYVDQPCGQCAVWICRLDTHAILVYESAAEIDTLLAKKGFYIERLDETE